MGSQMIYYAVHNVPNHFSVAMGSSELVSMLACEEKFQGILFVILI